MVITRSGFKSQGLDMDIFVDAGDLPVKKHIEFKGVERQREDKKKEVKKKKGKKK
jgi:hypothetical protein